MKMEELLQWFQNNGGNMFIEYNEYDLLELFLNEPVGIGELNEELIYSYKNDMGFSIVFFPACYRLFGFICAHVSFLPSRTAHRLQLRPFRQSYFRQWKSCQSTQGFFFS